MQSSSITPEQVTARIEVIEGGYKVDMGSLAFSIIGDQSGGNLKDRADFALYGLAILGMSNNLEIHLDAPVSSEALSNVREIGKVWQSYEFDQLYPLRLSVLETIQISNSDRSGGLICQSGGVDGTYSALRDKDALGLTHGLFVTGSDYLSEKSAGHDIRLNRTRQITDLLGLELVRARTDVRRCGFHFLRFFPMVLTMCLHFTGAGRDSGSYASDLPRDDEAILEKWSTNNQLTEPFLGTSDFPVHVLGYEAHRAGKLDYILRNMEALGPLVSVCYAPGNGGVNCGACEKCMRTRMNLESYGHDQKILFRDYVDLKEYFSTLAIPEDQFGKLRDIIYMSDAIRVLPDSPLRTVLADRVERTEKQLEK